MAEEVCGKETQVFSRISGYYRPVQNWNDGKAQEFKDRKEYDQQQAIEGEVLGGVKGDIATPETPIQAADEGTLDVDLDGLVLFATKTCPNCKAAKAFMEKLGITFKEVMADEYPELIQLFDLRTAPTLVNFKDGAVQDKITSYPSIRQYIAALPTDNTEECESCKF